MASKMNDTSTSEQNPTETGDAEREAMEMVLWTRRPVCGPRTNVIDRLSTLAANDDIRGFRVETWPDEVGISEHTEHTRVVARYKEFRSWAEDNNRSITPPFERRTVSPLIGEGREVLTLPIMCLAVYEGETLRGVYPSAVDGRTISVTEYLDACDDPDAAAVPTPMTPLDP
jgi:hypothetical protein